MGILTFLFCFSFLSVETMRLKSKAFGWSKLKLLWAVCFCCCLVSICGRRSCGWVGLFV